MKLFLNMFIISMTLFILFCLWDFTRWYYGKFKKLIHQGFEIHRLRKERKRKPKDVVNETISHDIKDQYAEILKGENI